MSAPVDPSHRPTARTTHTDDPARLGPSDLVTDRRVAEAYVASVCFKHGPPRKLGTELEWVVRNAADPTRRLDLDTLLRALGPYAPTTARRHGSGSLPEILPPSPLPRGGRVTLEPGGQVEIASPPLDSLAGLVDAVGHDVAQLRHRLAAAGLTLARRAGDPLRAPRRLLDVPRYAAMEAAFDRIGPHGRTMMCSTAAVQVSVDAGEGGDGGGDTAARWAALHEIGPTLTAAFANSPAVHGRRTGWKSSRMASWLSLDPARTSPPPVTGADPAGEYARRAVDTALMCVRPGDDADAWTAPRDLTFADWVAGALGTPPTRSDLDFHLTTLFPPVRPQGHLEVRYVDQQPGDEWIVPVAVLAAVLADPVTVDRARAAVAPAVGRWAAAARHGLADRVLRRSAGDLFELAHRTLTGPTFAGLASSVPEMVAGVMDRRVLAGRCPADDPVGEPGEDRLGPPLAPGHDIDDAGDDTGGLPGLPAPRENADPPHVPDDPFPIAGGDPT